ncbi:MAG: AsmA family protein [Sedimentisphaerales bacterium]|nr:AsmA family protein [Sedimentisphaerales bacterium]
MKAKKIIVNFVLIPLVVLLAVLVLVFFLIGNTLIKTGIEAAGSKTLGVPVTVKDIDLSILRGQVKIEGLVVKNPEGYANETLLELGQGTVKLNVGSLFSDTVKIELVELDGTKLTLEQKGLTNNLKEILNKLPKEDKPEEKPAAEKEGKNLNITKLEITNTNVKVKLLPIPGKADTLSMNLDTITMTDLGTDKKLKIGTLIAKVFGALAAGIAKQGVGLLPDDMVKGIGSAIGTTVEIGKTAVQGGQKALEKTADVGKGVIDGFTGLLGGKKEDPNKPKPPEK